MTKDELITNLESDLEEIFRIADKISSANHAHSRGTIKFWASYALNRIKKEKDNQKKE